MATDVATCAALYDDGDGTRCTKPGTHLLSQNGSVFPMCETHFLAVAVRYGDTYSYLRLDMP